jgi:serine/threonine-protein kinase
MPDITKLGKYLIRRELGKGAMGVVYEGFDPVIERSVAIKTILPKQLAGNEAAEVMARFKREAQAAGRLSHPGIVAVYDYGEAVAEDDQTLVAGAGPLDGAGQVVAYIAMEFVKGRELRDFFDANERFSLPDIKRLMGEILGALGHAHAHGVVHRDIKPANIIVLDNGSLKIADFGIARVEKSELTQAGTMMGTPAYMSPEQFLGQTIDGRSDLFSCGVILYQFLTGEKPFAGNTTTIMYKVLHEEPLAPSMLNVALPAVLDAVVKKAMAKNPDQRFQNVAEFAAALDSASVSAGLDATLVSPPRANVEPATARAANAAPAAVSPPTPGHAATPRSVSKPLLGGLAGMVLLAAAGAFFYFGKNATSTAPQTATVTPPLAPASSTTVQSEKPALPPDAAQEPGTIVISALGLVDPKDARFNGNPEAALFEVRADAKRQLVEKVLGLYVEGNSLNSHYPLIEQKLLSQSGSFIKTTLQESAPVTGKDGLLETETRAVLKVRDVQKSLNQLSKDERIDFIRNHGDPKVAIQMTLANADTAQVMPSTRSQLAENVLKERIKSFGFRVWSNEGEISPGPTTKVADFLVQGEAKVKQITAKLQASGLTISKTILTSWTVKAIDKASGEEIYLNTVTPKGQSWATEDQALLDIGKLMGEEFSKNFFLQHFNFGVSKTRLNVTGLPDTHTAHLLLRELLGVRQVLDVQLMSEDGKFQLQLADGNAADVLQEAVIRTLNAKLGKNCFALAGAAANEVSMSFSSTCADASLRGKLEDAPPAGLLSAPASRAKPLLKNSPLKTVV